jgi:hypothetical protein
MDERRKRSLPVSMIFLWRNFVFKCGSTKFVGNSPIHNKW